MSDNPATTDFGYRTVPRAAKGALVRGVFARVAPRYDLMNDLMSLGIHRLWKRRLLSLLDPQPGATLLDLAGGTGDISFAWQDANGGPVVLSDINQAMLAIAHARALARARLADLSLLVADAERLPLPDRSFHRVAIAFGLRNCTDKSAVLAEARRVLRPGGQFFCLEFSRLEIAALAPLYDAWSFAALPALGRLVAGDAASYRYLAESIRTFPDAETLAEMMGEAGFSRVRIERLSGGIAAIHSGWRL
jgi:demethylmenaquinone methyltransferase / 2-methoxy-6-polyprenyl-1,4-benzoquinol methylase